MDFTPELIAFQGAVISVDNVHKFSKLTTRGGNEEKFKYIIDNLTKFLEDGGYLNENGVRSDAIPTMRKFAFYLILNSDLPVVETLVEIEEIFTVIWTIPILPKCLLSKLIWNLRMENFLYEAIVFSHPQLALELLETFIHYTKYATPFSSMKRLKLLSTACYRLICRLHFFKIDDKPLTDKLKLLLTHFQKAINYYVEPPNAGKLDSLANDDQYKYKGKCLRTVLILVLECLEQFTTAEKIEDFNDIYHLTVDPETIEIESVTYRMCDSPHRLIADCLNKCNIYLMDKLKYLIMDVSVEIYCAWSEFEENGKSVQLIIGELCHKVHCKLLDISTLSDHPIVAMIQGISRKPMEFVDVINKMDNLTIIEHIEKNGEDKPAWIKALIYKEHLCREEELIYVLDGHLEYLTEEECYKLFKVLYSHLKNSVDMVEHIVLLSIKVFKRCNSTIKDEILSEHFSEKSFNEMLLSKDFTVTLIEVFNKLIASPDADLSDIWSLFLQSPRKVYMKVFNVAIENTQQSKLMLRVMKLLEKYATYFYARDTEACVIKVAQEIFEFYLDTEQRKENFVKFVSGLKESNIIPAPKMLLLIVMPNLHKALLNRDVNCLNIQCKLLKEAYSLAELVEFRAPMLAMLAQVMDAVRWRIHTFDERGPATLELVVQLQKTLLNTYQGTVPGTEARWLRSKLVHLQPMNIYYYRILWHAPGRNFVEVIVGMPLVNETSDENIVTWLSQVICSSILDEWFEIWDSLEILGTYRALNIFHNSLSLITIAENVNRTPLTWSCLQYAYRNYAQVLRYKFFKETLTEDHVKAALQTVAAIANLMHPGNVEDINTIFLPLFSYMVERKRDYSLDVASYLSDKLRHQKFADMVHRVFSA